jgi:hypothetical protein
MCIEAIRKFLSRPVNPPSPTPTPSETVTGSEVERIIMGRFPDVHLYLSDTVYRTCSKGELEVILADDTTNQMVYEAEKTDCDDFAYRLMGNMSIPPYSDLAIGIVWTAGHALNCFIDSNSQLWFIEPQTDKIFESLGNDSPWIIVL